MSHLVSIWPTLLPNLTSLWVKTKTKGPKSQCKCKVYNTCEYATFDVLETEAGGKIKWTLVRCCWSVTCDNGQGRLISSLNIRVYSYDKLWALDLVDRFDMWTFSTAAVLVGIWSHLVPLSLDSRHGFSMTHVWGQQPSVTGNAGRMSREREKR